MLSKNDGVHLETFHSAELKSISDSSMINTYKELIANQFEAVFCMLGTCVDRCPDTNWHARVANLKFCQVAFHTLIFTDLYLGRDLESFRQQAFHRKNVAVFADYEELEDRVPQQVYDKSFVKAYLQHCRDKASRVITAETVETLNIRPDFERKDFPRAELHVNNIRHIHHHAAQLSLRLRLDTNEDIPWINSGWHDV